MEKKVVDLTGAMKYNVDEVMLNTAAAPSQAQLDDLNFPDNTYSKDHVTYTVYGTPCPKILPGYTTPFTGHNLDNRISYTYSNPYSPGQPGYDDYSTYTIYSYDPHGNVDTLIQLLPGAPHAIRIAYQYDLISNKVVKVNQQKMYASVPFPYIISGEHDDYLGQWYSYDGDKRITQAQSTYSPTGAWTSEATYGYYLHGPLRRQVIGKAQGIDYTYTLEGWLKAINNSAQDAGLDPGGDDGSGATAVDAFGEVLNYYNGDFTRSGSPMGDGAHPLVGGELFNGNISSSQQRVVAPDGVALVQPGEVGYKYRYDQLNRITGDTFYVYRHPDKSHDWVWDLGQVPHGYDEGFTYDGNGNLMTLKRNTEVHNGAQGIVMDNLTYHYDNDAVSNRPTNRLIKLQDGANTAPWALGDVQNTGYDYDANGNVQDEYMGDTTLTYSWTPDNRLEEIDRYNGDGSYYAGHFYVYDAHGNRVVDYAYSDNGNTTDTTYYLYDANNTMLATYPMQNTTQLQDRMVPSERYVYGSDRIATLQGSNKLIHVGPFTNFLKVWAPATTERYELHDHLGSVRATFDRYYASVSAPNVPVRSTFSYYAFGPAGRNF